MWRRGLSLPHTPSASPPFCSSTLLTFLSISCHLLFLCPSPSFPLLILLFISPCRCPKVTKGTRYIIHNHHGSIPAAQTWDKNAACGAENNKCFDITKKIWREKDFSQHVAFFVFVAVIVLLCLVIVQYLIWCFYFLMFLEERIFFMPHYAFEMNHSYHFWRQNIGIFC